MNTQHDRFAGPGPHDGSDRSEAHGTDDWVLLDGVVAIVMGVTAIVRVVLRHAVGMLLLAILIAVIGTIAGWWMP